MSVDKLGCTKTSEDSKYLNLSEDEIISLHNRIVNAWETNLRKYGVKPLWKNQPTDTKSLSKKDIIALYNNRELQLIFLLKYYKKLVHKDLISAFVRQYITDAALDQQVRHLGTQYYWNILNRNERIPDEDIKVPSGYHYLVSIDQPNPKLIYERLKREGRISATSFEDLKIIYDYKCATCGRKESDIDERNGKIEVELQQGHMDPSKSLSLSNIIPQCQYCNQTYGNDFCFNEYGRVVAVYNPNVVLRSPKHIQDEMITVLLEERRNSEK